MLVEYMCGFYFCLGVFSVMMTRPVKKDLIDVQCVF